MRNNKAKILFLDIETAPAKAFTWGLWDVNIGINQIIEDGYILMWAAKWLGEKEILWDSVREHTKNPREYPKSAEKKIAQSIWKLVDEADIIVTHNGDSFDMKWLNATFIKHGLPPASTYKSVDTKKEAKKAARFLSNKLDYIGRKLKKGKKIHTDFELWTGCLAGNKTSWGKMVRYCQQDVRLLERIYLMLRPFMKMHPNLGLFHQGHEGVCPNCASARIQKKGFFYTVNGKYQRYRCLECGKNIRDTHRLSGVGLVGI